MRAFGQAERVFEETYSSPSMFHHPMEPVGGCLAHYINGEANVWLPTSSPTRDAAEFAHFLGIEADKVRVRVPYVGGGFGSKIPTPAHFAALFLSRKIGRPVRLMPSAEESFRQNSRHAEVFKAKVGVKADGTLTALDVDLSSTPVLTQPAGNRGAQLGDFRLGLLSHPAPAHPGQAASTPTKFPPATPAPPAKFKPPGASSAPWTAWRARWVSTPTSFAKRMCCCAAISSARARPPWTRIIST